MTNTKKLALGGKIQELLTKYQNFALVKIDKTSHQTLEKLRKELKKDQANFKVVKNTLFEKTIAKLAKGNKSYEELKKNFFPVKETSALLLFEKNWDSGLKTFYEFIKKETSLSFKFGILDNQSYPNEEILKIAKLPAKNQLMANLIGSFKSPSYRLVNSLKFNVTKLIYILKEKSKQAN